jgi:hypothetical protein
MTSTFQHQSYETTLVEIADNEYPTECYRVAPNCISFNGIDIPRPLAVKPTVGEVYFYWDMHTHRGYEEDRWDDFQTDENRYDSRLIWAKESDAMEAVAAIRKLMNS